MTIPVAALEGFADAVMEAVSIAKSRGWLKHAAIR